MNNSNLSIFNFESKNIRFEKRNDRVWVNLTDMAKASKKQFGHWNNLKSTTQFLSAFAKSIGMTIDQIIYSNESSGNNNERGTWGVEEVAIEFAGWCSVDFKIWMIQQIKTLMTEGYVSLQPLSPAEAIIKSLQLWQQQQEQILAVQAEQQKQAVQIEVARVLAEQNQATIAIQQQKIDSLEASLNALRAVINQPLPTCQQTKRQRIVETMQLIGRVIFERKLKPTVPEAMREAWVQLTSKIKHSSARKDLPLQKANMERAYTKAMEDWKVHGGVKPRKKDYFLTYGELIERNKIEDEALSCVNTLALQLI